MKNHPIFALAQLFFTVQKDMLPYLTIPTLTIALLLKRQLNCYNRVGENCTGTYAVGQIVAQVVRLTLFSDGVRFISATITKT